ncbi:SusC/RagA family TonB-linked outer membrane protein [Flexithrix dorotheae]|uniref:SusC/RagA family TonB-linked outer membrane protein n=1 Tax=Flexithrix dorotheae TaxID=70993 RepID=UPI00037A09FD|nr:SusC/RagA family TonB-linked outer membrane protein [Flexithrix dorotheae]
MRKILHPFLWLGFIFLCHTSFAQDKEITGKIISSEDNEPLPGVSVIVKGTSSGTISDIDGNYRLNVPEGNDLIVFSYVGFETQEVQIGSQSVIDVTLLLDTKQLQEVVVTAIGLEANKQDLGYSIQQVDGDELTKSRETNMIAGLSGKVAGVQVTSSGGVPGSAAQIRIRGNKSIQGSNSPLFVVDGVPIDNSSFNSADSPEDAVGDLSSGGAQGSNRAIDINPNDIASMTVLKGPAATALYGIRASNGAIIITTKKGSKGKPRVSYNAYFTVDEVNKLPDLQTTYGQGRFTGGAITYRGPETFEGFSWGPAISDLRYSNSLNSAYNTNGRAIVHSSDPTASGDLVPAFNNADNFFQPGYSFDNTLSVSGGNDNTTYYMSASKLDQSGIVPTTDFQRTSFKATITTKISEKFQASFSANYVNSGGRKVQNGSNTSGVMLGLLRTTPTFDNANGHGSDGYKFSDAYLFDDNTPRAYRGQISGSAIYDNPLFTINRNYQTDEVNRFIGYAFLGYDITPWMKVSYRLGVDSYTDFRKFRSDIGSGTLAAGQVINQEYANKDLNGDLLLTINKELTSDLNLNATIGHNFYKKTTDNRRIDGQGLASFGFFNMASPNSFAVSELPTEKQLYGVFADLRFSYKNQFFLNVTGRNDWTSTLSNDNNSFFYPAVAGGWAFTESLGWDDSPILPYGKLRVSWGKVGNDAPFGKTTKITYYQARVRDGWTTPNGVIYPAFGQNSFIPNSLLGNPDLRPEFTTTFEVGADLRFWDGRITADITYYNALTEDIILEVDIPRSSGKLSRAQNSGEIENKGVEIALNANIIRSPSSFNYDIGVNFTKYTSTVNKLAEGLEVITIDPFGTQRIQAGESYGIFYGTRFLRNNEGKVIIDPTDGMPLEAPTSAKVGDPTPDFLLGFRNTFTYKGLSLSFLLDFRKGGDIYNGTSGVLNNFGVSTQTLDRNETVVFDGVLRDTGLDDANGVQIGGEVNNIEVVKGGTDGGTNYYQNYGFVGLDELSVQDGSWVRLRDLTISYNFPSSMFENNFIENLTIGFTARNLFLITDYTGIDPETNLTGDASNVLGYDYFNNPNTKSYGVNLNLSF